MAYENLSTFLKTTDDDWVLKLMAHSAPNGVNISPTNKRISKLRRYPRERLMHLRQERTKLELELQILKEKHQFQETLKAKSSSFGLSWRLCAMQERILANSASRENSRLRMLVTANAKLIHRVSRLAHRQQLDVMPISVQVDSRIMNFGDHAQMYRTLRSSLEFRSKWQLDAIVDHCSAQSFDSARDHDWRPFVLEGIGVGVDFHEAVILPFSSSFICGLLNRWPLVNAVGVWKSIVLPQATTRTSLTEPIVLDRRLILRRSVNAKKRTIILWEDAFRWQNNANSPSVVVRGSGWALIAPYESHEDTISIVHSGGLIQLQGTESPLLSPTDTEVRDILAHAQVMQRSRIAGLEHVLIDANRIMS